MSDFSTFTKQIDGLEDEALDAAIVATIKSGVPVPKDLAITAVGRAENIAWWDYEILPGWIENLPQFDAYRAAAARVPADGFMVCDGSTIPEAVWASHRVDYSRPGGHGLKLEDAPACVALVRSQSGLAGFTIGYRAAS